jgi:hypothetical protein
MRCAGFNLQLIQQDRPLTYFDVIARQRLAKHVPERYDVNENRRPLLNNGFYHADMNSSNGTFGGCDLY